MRVTDLIRSKVVNGRCTYGHELTYEIMVSAVTVRGLLTDTGLRWFHMYEACPICFWIHARCAYVSRMTAQEVQIEKPNVFNNATESALRAFRRGYEDDPM
jgi:hypothetical protein